MAGLRRGIAGCRSQRRRHLRIRGSGEHRHNAAFNQAFAGHALLLGNKEDYLGPWLIEFAVAVLNGLLLLAALIWIDRRNAGEESDSVPQD